jgi:hypothetical protein
MKLKYKITIRLKISLYRIYKKAINRMVLTVIFCQKLLWLIGMILIEAVLRKNAYLPWFIVYLF